MYPHMIRVDSQLFSMWEGTGKLKDLGSPMMVRCNFEHDIILFKDIHCRHVYCPTDPLFLERARNLFKDLDGPSLIKRVQTAGIDTLRQITRVAIRKSSLGCDVFANYAPFQSLLPALESLQYIFLARSCRHHGDAGSKCLHWRDQSIVMTEIGQSTCYWDQLSQQNARLTGLGELLQRVLEFYEQMSWELDD